MHMAGVSERIEAFFPGQTESDIHTQTQVL